jgi:hypothetical protein
MLFFQSPARNASASLDFPILRIEYSDQPWIIPKHQDHQVFRVELAAAGGSLGGHMERHEMRDEMPGIGSFLFSLDEDMVDSKTWSYDSHSLRIDFTTPMRVGEYDNIEFMIMTYNPRWARTEAMLRAHAEWRTRVN